MGVIQHKLAHQVLAIIQEGIKSHRLHTYQNVAKALGRPQDNARAIAQACDLLDAAAALAGVPLLALVAIRTASGDINPKAWVKNTPAGIREAIIARSLSHRFSEIDFIAIEKALNELRDYGNKSAWQEVKRKIPNIYDKLTFIGAFEQKDKNYDAINDIGSDLPEKDSVSVTRFSRDLKVRRTVEIRAQGRCELCGKLGFTRPNGSHYVETHHIIALAKDGADRVTNVIALCPEHHREAHFGAASDDLEKEMILKVNEKNKEQSNFSAS